MTQVLFQCKKFLLERNTIFDSISAIHRVRRKNKTPALNKDKKAETQWVRSSMVHQTLA